jgi:hypothetical protein
MDSISKKLNDENWEVTLNDSRIVDRDQLYKFRIHPRLFEVGLPVDNILNARPGKTMAVADGFWVMLKPLSPGDHVLHFGTDLSFQRGSTEDGEVSYNLAIR